MALEVLHARAETIWLEPHAPFNEGAEFLVERSDRVEAHQVKRQIGVRDSWPLSALRDTRVLDAAQSHADAGREYHFVSIVPVRRLEELAERARGAHDVDEFATRVTGELVKAYDFLRSSNVWGDAESTFRTLRQLHVHVRQPDALASENAILAEALFEGAPGRAIAAVLSEILVLSSGRRLDATALVDVIRRQDIGLRDVTHARAGHDVEDATNVWLDSASAIRLDPRIARPEGSQLAALVRAGEHPLIVATGSAGAGKSAILVDVVEQLRAQHWPVLALRLDRAPDAQTSQQLGEGLPHRLSGSPVRVLGEHARGRRCALVADQLDAISFVAGRSDRMIDVVGALLREASAFPEMRVLLACRRFDWDEDDRFRELAVRKSRPYVVAINELTLDQAAAATAAMGVDPKRLALHQQELLRNPFRLVLLQSIVAETTPGEVLEFATEEDLLARYWTAKERACRRARNRVRFDDVVSALANEMSEKRMLAVSVSALDGGLAEDADVLRSEGVLRGTADKRIAFFHEAFFDYAFARSWVRRGEDLVSFLANGPQDLFRRAQVRQILLHLHAADPERFGWELERLLSDPSIRFHLKHVGIAVVGALMAPGAEAWGAISRTLEAGPEAIARRIRAALHTVGWFERLMGEGVLERWLADDSTRRQASRIMAAAAKEAPDRVAGVLSRHADDPRFDVWIEHAARFGNLRDSRVLLDLVIGAVRRGAWNPDMRWLWMYAAELAEKPAWAVELLAAYFIEAPGALELEDGRIKRIAGRDDHAQQLIAAAARGAPAGFWRRFGPWLLEVVRLSETPDEAGPPIRDAQFARWWRRLGRDHVDSALLAGAATALRAMATDKSEVPTSEFEGILKSLAADTHETARWLLFEALRAAGSEFADFAAATLVQGPWRLGPHLAADPNGAARELLAVITPFVSAANFAALEKVILGYRPPDARPGQYQVEHNLLSGLAFERLSDQGRRRILELNRLYGEVAPSLPPMRSGWAQSPVPESALRHMTDEQWRRALQKHAIEPPEFRAGGAEQLAEQLRRATAEDPARFVRLSETSEFAASEHYLSAVLAGLSETTETVDPDLVFGFIRRLSGVTQDDHVRRIGAALRPVAGSEIPDDLLELLASFALNAEDPRPGSGRMMSSHRDDDDDDYPVMDIHTEGMNRTRGSLMLSLAQLIANDTDGRRTAVVVPYLPQLAQDPSAAVRTCVAELILQCARHAPKDALQAYVTAAEGQDEALATRPFERLTYWVAEHDMTSALATVDRMLVSTNPRTRRAAGRLASVLGLGHSRPDLVQRVVSARDHQIRRGAATGCSSSVLAWPKEAAAATVTLLGDGDRGVSTRAAEVAAVLRGERLQPYASVVNAVIASDAFDDAVPQLLITLEQAPDQVGTFVLATADRFVADHREELGDISTSAAGEARSLSSLVTRAYTQATSDGERDHALNLIDDLLFAGAYGAESALDDVRR